MSERPRLSISFCISDDYAQHMAVVAATMHKKLRPLATAPLLIGRRIVPRGLRPWQAYLLATRGRFYP